MGVIPREALAAKARRRFVGGQVADVLMAVGVFLAVLLSVAWLVRTRRAGAPAVVQAMAAGAQLVDVRTPAEFLADPVPAARNIPLEQLAARRLELDPRLPVVLFCASGWRSAQAARVLTAAGFGRVVDGGARDELPDELVGA